MKKEFIRIGKMLFQEGLVHSHSGNMSVRDGDKIYITKRDTMLGDLSEDSIIEVSLTPGDNDQLASRELPAHRALYQKTKAQAIIHAHPVSAIAISITDNKIVPQDAEGLFLYKAAPIVRVRDSIGSEETARLLPSFLNNDNVIAVVKAHGSFAIGASLEEAYKYTSSLESSCKILVAVRSAASAQTSQSHPRRDKADQPHRRSAIPQGIGVMDRSRYTRR